MGVSIMKGKENIMSDVTIKDEGEYTILTSPYNGKAVKRARELHGKFDYQTKAWRFDKRDHDRVVALARDVYGYSEDPDTPTVTVRINAEDHRDADNGVQFAGRTVAHRPGRDSRVRLADNVVVVEGHFPESSGSMKYPTALEAGDHVVLEVRDIPSSSLTLEKEDSYTIVDGAKERRQALEDEKKRLLERIRQIDIELKEGER